MIKTQDGLIGGFVPTAVIEDPKIFWGPVKVYVLVCVSFV